MVAKTDYRGRYDAKRKRTTALVFRNGGLAEWTNFEQSKPVPLPHDVSVQEVQRS